MEFFNGLLGADFAPSVHDGVTNFIAHGVVSERLGIGIYFSGDVWIGGNGTSTGGASMPRQTWFDMNEPKITNVAYHYVMDTYFLPSRYHWDEPAQAAYLTIDNPGTNDLFISYEDEQTCRAKIAYARNYGLGGIFVFELGNGYRTNQPTGQRDVLLQAIKRGVATPAFTSIQRSGGEIRLSFTTLPFSSYRVRTTSNVTSAIWTTLVNNVPGGSNGNVTVSDPDALTNQPRRFYRVETP